MKRFYSLKIFAAVVLTTVSLTVNAQSYKPSSYASLYKIYFPQIHFISATDAQMQKFTETRCPNFMIKADKSAVSIKPCFDINLDEILVDPILSTILGPSDYDIDHAYDKNNPSHIIVPSCVGKMKMSQIETPKWAENQYGGSQF